MCWMLVPVTAMEEGEGQVWDGGSGSGILHQGHPSGERRTRVGLCAVGECPLRVCRLGGREGFGCSLGRANPLYPEA